MKAKIVLVVSIAFWLIVSSAAYAADPYWNRWHWDCYASTGMLGGERLLYGVVPGASDGYDVDKPLFGLNDPELDIHAGIYHENGVDGWNGPSGFYSDDWRTPVPLVEGASKSWFVYLWADPELDSSVSSINFVARITTAYLVPRDFRYTLTLLRKPGGIEGGPAVGTSYDMSYYTFHWGAEFVLPAYRTTDGRDGYLLELRATAVPEPTSLLALAAGIAGLVIRRRR